jgi:dTDP-4-dehydrorhamnose reductase
MRIVVTGASGRLGSLLVDRLIGGGHEVIAWSGTSRGSRGGIALRPVDLTDERATASALEQADPEAVIHAGAMSSSDAVFRDPACGWAVNVEATRRLADWASGHDRRFLFTSTDLVFDGSRSWYREDDPADPILAYGRTKRAAESFVLALPRGLVARISLLYGSTRGGSPDFCERALSAIAQGQRQSFFADEYRTPLDYRTAAEILARLIESEITGILHVGGPERLSRFELMRRAAIARQVDPNYVCPNRRADAMSSEPRPADVSLDTSRLSALLPDLERPRVEAAVTATIA